MSVKYEAEEDAYFPGTILCVGHLAFLLWMYKYRDILLLICTNLNVSSSEALVIGHNKKEASA